MDEYHLTVRVDRLTFEVQLPGQRGMRAMRDFVAVSQERRRTLSAQP